MSGANLNIWREKMKRKLKFITFVFALSVFIIPVSAQIDKSMKAEVPRETFGRVKVPTLGCCECLNGTNTLDLSTVAGNNWTVNGNPVAFVNPVNGLWNLDTQSVKWVSTTVNGSIGSVPVGDFEYRLSFSVPDCTIGQEVALSGFSGGDDGMEIFLDNIKLAQCITGWCFNTQKPLTTFTSSITPGTHNLVVKVHNSGGPSGMFVNAKLTSRCSNSLTKNTKDIGFAQKH